MGLFKQKPRPTDAELKCPVAGCPFTCKVQASLKRHTDWKHPELAKAADK